MYIAVYIVLLINENSIDISDFVIMLCKLDDRSHLGIKSCMFEEHAGVFRKRERDREREVHVVCRSPFYALNAICYMCMCLAEPCMDCGLFSSLLVGCEFLVSFLVCHLSPLYRYFQDYRYVYVRLY